MPTRSIADTYFAIPELMRVARGSYKRAVDERLAAGGFDDLPTASGYLLGISAVVLLLIFPRRGSGTGTTKAAIVFAAVAVLGAPSRCLSLGRRQQAGTVRHAVRGSPRVEAGPLARCRGRANRDAAPTARAGKASACDTRLDGYADLRRRRPVHLRHRPRGPADRRIHRHDPATNPHRLAVDDRPPRLPPRHPGSGCQRPTPRMDRQPLPSAQFRCEIVHIPRQIAVRVLLLRPKQPPVSVRAKPRRVTESHPCPLESSATPSSRTEVWCGRARVG